MFFFFCEFLGYITFFFQRRLQTERRVNVAENVTGNQVPDDDFSVVTRRRQQVGRRDVDRQDVVLMSVCLKEYWKLKPEVSYKMTTTHQIVTPIWLWWLQVSNRSALCRVVVDVNMFVPSNCDDVPSKA